MKREGVWEGHTHTHNTHEIHTCHSHSTPTAHPLAHNTHATPTPNTRPVISASEEPYNLLAHLITHTHTATITHTPKHTHNTRTTPKTTHTHTTPTCAQIAPAQRTHTTPTRYLHDTHPRASCMRACTHPCPLPHDTRTTRTAHARPRPHPRDTHTTPARHLHGTHLRPRARTPGPSSLPAAAPSSPPRRSSPAGPGPCMRTHNVHVFI